MLRPLAVVLCLLAVSVADDFDEAFRNCHPNSNGFDGCVRKGLNKIRPYFKSGVPKYNFKPFDPFFRREISVTRGLPNLGYTLTLRNVSESGWSTSKVTNFVTDLSNYKVVYTQSFPAKFLAGGYEFVLNVGGPAIVNKGRFTLDLYDLTQTTSVIRRPGQKLTVQVDVQSIRDLKLHITNLLNGRIVLENFVDGLINRMWQTGFVFTRALINKLVSTAFTEIFRENFQNFEFEKILKKQN